MRSPGWRKQGTWLAQPATTLGAAICAGLAFAAGTRLFLFNEQDAGCAEHLEELVAELRESRKPWPENVKINTFNATFIELTTGLVNDLDSRNVRLAPTFAFVDPVGVKATPCQCCSG